MKSYDREPLLKGKAQCGWPPCTYSFQSAAFYIAIILYFLNKQIILIRRSTVLGLPSIPWTGFVCHLFRHVVQFPEFRWVDVDVPVEVGEVRQQVVESEK
jgi:hypothetical protein